VNLIQVLPLRESDWLDRERAANSSGTFIVRNARAHKLRAALRYDVNADG
jgi:hypothetical protein